MPIKKQIVADRLVPEVQETRTFVGAARTDEEQREDMAAIVSLATEHNRRATFDGRVADLERVCRRDLPAPDALYPVVGSRAWYAREIVLAISATRQWLAQGKADLAASEAFAVGALAAEAEARHHWSAVQHGIKNQRSVRQAAHESGKATTRNALMRDEKLRATIRRYQATGDPFSHRDLARAHGVSPKTIERRLKKMGITIPD